MNDEQILEKKQIQQVLNKISKVFREVVEFYDEIRVSSEKMTKRIEKLLDEMEDVIE